MKIDEHIILLLNKYNLNKLYYKYIFISIISSTIRESFYWLLIYFSTLIQDNSNLINKCSYILIMLLILNIPLERYFNYIKALLLKELKIANSKFFYERITKISKTKILDINLVEYNNIIEHLNDDIDNYIYNIKLKYDIPLRFISLIIISINKKLNLLIGLFFIYYALVKILNEWKNIKEFELNNDYIKYENIIRNYIINSKNLLVNEQLNNTYLYDNVTNYQDINKNINEINNNLDMKINIIILIYIFLVMYENNYIDKSNFLYYFFIVYDIEYIGDKINRYYTNLIYFNKMQQRLIYLYKYKHNIKNIDTNRSHNIINTIQINNIFNNNPKLNINNITINKNDHILIYGCSGSGKTSLLYVLKGLIIADKIDIVPDINDINSQTFLSLPNHKNIYSGYLFDIITNFEKNPDINLINESLKLSKFNNYTNNEYINIEQLSSGERIRLYIAQIIYNVIKFNYNILLFDEIDQNLNDIKGYGDSLLNNEINKRKENIKNEAMNEISNRIFK
jgi:ABC-type lipoprotein export system ATPase subunit